MASKFYKFPCSCGSSQPIEVSQAGSEIKCLECGAVRVVPTMLKIKQLDEVVEVAKKRKEETGVFRRGFFWFGLILLFPSVIALIYFAGRYPHPREVSQKVVYLSYGEKMLVQDSTPIPQYEHAVLWTTDKDVDRMFPFDLFRYFEVLQLGSNFSYNFQMNYQELKYKYYTRVVIFSLLVLASVVCIVVSFFMPKRSVIVDGWSGSEWERKRKNT
ncbi:MAG: hypothetical protein LBJ00_06370 [Planctomycetaceae bacterium]|jgi:ribosomal protein S27E|nr:hypothetical protein [Planctomycetaceae bacterium]